MSAIQTLINRCSQEASTLGMANLKRQAEEAASELAAKDAIIARLVEAGKTSMIWVEPDGEVVCSCCCMPQSWKREDKGHMEHFDDCKLASAIRAAEEAR